MANNINSKASNKEVEDWLAEEIKVIRQQYIGQPDQSNQAIAQLYIDRLTAGQHQEYRYSDIATTERYSLPLIAR